MIEWHNASDKSVSPPNVRSGKKKCILKLTDNISVCNDLPSALEGDRGALKANGGHLTRNEGNINSFDQFKMDGQGTAQGLMK